VVRETPSPDFGVTMISVASSASGTRNMAQAQVTNICKIQLVKSKETNMVTMQNFKLVSDKFI